jgi:hypothetical protein
MLPASPGPPDGLGPLGSINPIAFAAALTSSQAAGIDRRTWTPVAAPPGREDSLNLFGLDDLASAFALTMTPVRSAAVA